MAVVFSFDNLHILGVMDEHVFVRARNSENDEECVAKLTRKKFHETLDLWLNDKKAYCERYNHFCGVMGQIFCDEYNIEGQTNLRPEGGGELINVDLCYIISFDDTTDMEHG